MKTVAELLSFFIGSIPFARIWSFLLGGQDVSKHGSRNVGTSNAWRVNGKLIGILTALSDVLKGFLCMLLPGHATKNGALAVLGHMYTPWTNGKGVATLFGITLAIFKLYALIPICLWIALVSLKVKPRHASYTALSIILLLSYLSSNEETFYTFIILAIAIIFKHETSKHKI
ncbi:MAG: glycerol-3-phosphate acyltransferase [Alphaproteobacteria bacterium]|nr:MAG: glycerol-3-phosphate acyltransferase [Alphaproteobacteria bacterium]